MTGGSEAHNEGAGPQKTIGSLALGPEWKIGRITRIEITDYRAVRGRLTLELPDGQNAIIYGENGSGKSSIFHALRDFLESSESFHFSNNNFVIQRLPIITNRHLYTTSEPKIALHFGSVQFTWSAADKGPEAAEVRDLNKGKGFLDYRVLQAVHYLPFDDREDIDLFKLFIGRLLPYVAFPFEGRQHQFQLFWRQMNNVVRRRWHRDQEPVFLESLSAFNAAIEAAVHDLGSRANKLLAAFGDEFQTEFVFQPAVFKRRPKRLQPPVASITG